jgi:hypothetical protein
MSRCVGYIRCWVDYEFAVITGWLDFGEEDEDEEMDKEDDGDGAFVVRTEAEVPAVAGQLADLITERAAVFEDQAFDVDALLARIGDPVTEYLDVRRAAGVGSRRPLRGSGPGPGALEARS